MQINQNKSKRNIILLLRENTFNSKHKIQLLRKNVDFESLIVSNPSSRTNNRFILIVVENSTALFR